MPNFRAFISNFKANLRTQSNPILSTNLWEKMSAVCTICALPAPTGLAMLSSCLHSFHTACLRQYVQAHGRCPQPECTRPAGETDIRVLILDPPQPGGGGQRVAEVRQIPKLEKRD
jgi:hypothetical protein